MWWHREQSCSVWSRGPSNALLFPILQPGSTYVVSFWSQQRAVTHPYHQKLICDWFNQQCNVSPWFALIDFVRSQQELCTFKCIRQCCAKTFALNKEILWPGDRKGSLFLTSGIWRRKSCSSSSRSPWPSSSTSSSPSSRSSSGPGLLADDLSHQTYRWKTSTQRLGGHGYVAFIWASTWSWLGGVFYP